MSAFWWVVLIVVLMLMPMSMLKPSARQKHLVLLREAARRLGIKVTLLPQEITAGLRLEGAAYRWIRPADAPALPGYFCLLRRVEGRERGERWNEAWDLVCGQQRQMQAPWRAGLNQWLQVLPEDAQAVEWGSAGVTLWWGERSDVAGLERVDQRVRPLLRHDVLPKEALNT